MPQAESKKRRKVTVKSGVLRGTYTDKQHTKEEKDGTFTSNTIMSDGKGAYYHGRKSGGRNPSLARRMAEMRARTKMVTAPADSLRASKMTPDDYDALLEKKKKSKIGKFFKRKKK